MMPKTSGIISVTRGKHSRKPAFTGIRAGLSVTNFVSGGNSPRKDMEKKVLGTGLIAYGYGFQESYE
jgi:threonine dehydratase